jgi:hypothetical protein
MNLLDAKKSTLVARTRHVHRRSRRTKEKSVSGLKTKRNASTWGPRRRSEFKPKRL